ncbi:MAG: AAA family ATPase, partial [Chloroflexota bacterium]|nr:AAA family ATPase [Chloroflexota bacterium]
MAGRIASPLLIGRDDELALLARGYDEAAGGRGSTVLIGGEAGIGKSRLLAAAFDVARRDEAVVLLGGAVGLADGAMPFAPIVEALRPLVRMVDDEAAAPEVSARVREAFAVVADELGLGGVTRAQGAGIAELRPDWARGRLYESVLELMRRLAVERPVVLAIEDLHWADESTRELLLFLVRNARAERLLLIGTFRSDELHRRHPLLPWLAEVDRAPGTQRVELHRLGRHDVERQLGEILGAVPRPDLVDAVFARSEGNPFYAEELIASGVASQRLPTTLREVLSARLAVVSDTTLRVLGVAAIAGRRVDHQLLLNVAGVPEAALLDALREATAAQLLTADDLA